MPSYTTGNHVKTELHDSIKMIVKWPMRLCNTTFREFLMELNTNISAHYGLLFVCEVIDLIHIKQMEFITQVAKVCFI